MKNALDLCSSKAVNVKNSSKGKLKWCEAVKLNEKFLQQFPSDGISFPRLLVLFVGKIFSVFSEVVEGFVAVKIFVFVVEDSGFSVTIFGIVVNPSGLFEIIICFVVKFFSVVVGELSVVMLG